VTGARWAIANAHCSKPPNERLAIGAVIVTDDKARNSVPRKGFSNNIWVLIASATAGAILGDNIGYWIGDSAFACCSAMAAISG
jgi:uncharacterized membrane protein YoaK (UPF0700 family)